MRKMEDEGNERRLRAIDSLLQERRGAESRLKTLRRMPRFNEKREPSRKRNGVIIMQARK